MPSKSYIIIGSWEGNTIYLDFIVAEGLLSVLVLGMDGRCSRDSSFWLYYECRGRVFCTFFSLFPSPFVSFPGPTLPSQVRSRFPCEKDTQLPGGIQIEINNHTLLRVPRSQWQGRGQRALCVTWPFLRGPLALVPILEEWKPVQARFGGLAKTNTLFQSGSPVLPKKQRKQKQTCAVV